MRDNLAVLGAAVVAIGIHVIWRIAFLKMGDEIAGATIGTAVSTVWFCWFMWRMGWLEANNAKD